MASGHMNRVKRPDTWLHRPRLQNLKKDLANPEPSTHDPQATWTGPLSAFNPRSADGAGEFCLTITFCKTVVAERPLPRIPFT
jgi:hypothetical protein